MLIKNALYCYLSVFVLALFACSPSFALDTNIEESDYLDNYLLTKITYKDFTLSQGVSAYEINSRLYISLSEFSEALGFALEVFPEEKTAKGWFIKTDNEFYLSVNDNVLVTKGKNFTINSSDILLIDNDLFISDSAYTRWFGITTNLTMSTLTIDITSKEPLQIELQQEREKRREHFGKKVKPEKPTYPMTEHPYMLASAPSLTLQTGATYQATGDDDEHAANYTIRGASDLAYMSAEYFIQGDNNEDLNDIRLKLSRYDESGNIIKGTDIKNIAIGDITPANLNFVGGGGVERGIYFTNKARSQSSNPDNIVIEGEVEPGWEVELFRNNEFLGFITDTADGRFEFTGLSLKTGVNLFKIVKYGPFGEEVAEYRRFYLGDGMLNAGEFRYATSASQQGEALIPLDETSDPSADIRIISEMEYGVNENLSIGGGYFMGPIFGDQTSAATLSARHSKWGIFSKLDYLQSLDSGSIFSLSNKTNLAKFDLSSLYTKYYDFDEADQELDYTFNFNISRPFYAPLIRNFTVNLGYEENNFIEDRQTQTYTNQLSTNLGGYAVSNELEYEADTVADDVTETSSGSFFFRKRIQDLWFWHNLDWLLRTRVNYKILPEEVFDTMRYDFETSLFKDHNLRLNYEQNLSTTRLSTYGASFNYNHDKVASSWSGSYNSNDDYTLGVNLRVNLNQTDDSYIPKLGNIRESLKGNVLAKAFLDTNFNGTFDNNEELLEGVQFIASTGQTSSLNENGTATISGLTSYRPSNISVDLTSLPDIYMSPTLEATTLIPRAGTTANVVFPIIVGGEIDGIINIYPYEIIHAFNFAKLPISLIDTTTGDIVKQTFADDSGYYLFDRIKPGTYHITIDPSALNDFETDMTTSEPFVLLQEELLVTDINFDLAVKAPVEEKDLKTIFY